MQRAVPPSRVALFYWLLSDKFTVKCGITPFRWISLLAKHGVLLSATYIYSVWRQSSDNYTDEIKNKRIVRFIFDNWYGNLGWRSSQTEIKDYDQ